MPLTKVRPGQTAKLNEIDPNDTGGIKSKTEAKDRLADNPQILSTHLQR